MDTASDIPLWPNLSAKQLLVAIGKDNVVAVETYPIRDRAWKSVKLSHVFRLINGDKLFIKRWGVKCCLGLSDAIQRIETPLVPVHMFHDLKINRKGIDLALKSKAAQLRKSPSHTVNSDDDQLLNTSVHCHPKLNMVMLKHPEVHSQRSTKRRRISQDSYGSARAPIVVGGSSSHSSSQRRHISQVNYRSGRAPIVVDSSSSRSSSPMSISPPSTASAMHYPYSQTIRSAASSTDSLPSVSELMDARPPFTAPTVKTSKPWPNRRYTIDIRHGVEAMNAPALKGLGQKAQFEAVFPGIVYHQSTFNDARRRWEQASESLRVALLDAGRTPGGLWDVLRKQVKLKAPKNNPTQSRKAMTRAMAGSDSEIEIVAESSRPKGKGRAVGHSIPETEWDLSLDAADLELYASDSKSESDSGFTMHRYPYF
jgi:hypothetical protein